MKQLLQVASVLRKCVIKVLRWYYYVDCKFVGSFTSRRTTAISYKFPPTHGVHDEMRREQM